MVKAFAVSEIHSGDYVANLMSVVTPVQNAYVPVLLQSPQILTLVSVLNLLLLVAVGGCAWFDSRRYRPTGDLAVVTLAGMFLAGPLLVGLLSSTSHSYIAIPARYGLASS